MGLLTAAWPLAAQGNTTAVISQQIQFLLSGRDTDGYRDVIVPAEDTILSGFGYDPTTVVASTGVTPYLGAPANPGGLASPSR